MCSSYFGDASKVCRSNTLFTGYNKKSPTSSGTFDVHVCMHTNTWTYNKYIHNVSVYIKKTLCMTFITYIFWAGKKIDRWDKIKLKRNLKDKTTRQKETRSDCTRRIDHQFYKQSSFPSRSFSSLTADEAFSVQKP